MGHDYIDFGEKQVRLDDFHIWTLRHLFLHCAQNATPASLQTDEATLIELQKYIDSWEWLGPGVFTNTDLAKFATNDCRVEVLRRLFDRTMNYVRTFGDAISSEYLETHVNGKSAYFTVAQPASIYLEAIQNLTDMLPKT